MVEEDLVARLNADATLVGLVGADDKGVLKLYPGEAPQGLPAPYIVFHSVDTDPARTMDDKSVDDISLHFEAHAPTITEAVAIGRQLRLSLDGWRTNAPSAVMSMSFAGAHDGAGAFDEDTRRRRTFSREILFTCQARA